MLVEINRRNNDSRVNLKPESTNENLTSLDLPKIKLPLFTGEFINWIPFFETFKTLVHNNKRLDDIQKFHYLRSSLTGAALNRIKSLDITSKNYLAALKLLTDRYDNQKLVAKDHIRALFNLPTMDKGSSEKLRELIDSLNNHHNSLKGLGRPTGHWDDLVVYLVLQRLDTFTRAKWEDKSPFDRLASLDELLVFLNKRCHTIEGLGLLKFITPGSTKNANSSTTRSEGSNQDNKQVIIQTSTSAICQAATGSFYSTESNTTTTTQCQVILATAVIQVLDKYGLPTTCRALLDSGSQLHFITEYLAQKLGVKRFKILNPISGIGNTRVNTKESTILEINSRLTNFSSKIEAFILPRITGHQPSSFIDIHNSWPIPDNIELADPSFNSPQTIDMLIGAELYCSLILEGQIKLNGNAPLLQNTTFGWIVTGKTTSPQTTYHCNVVSTISNPSLEQLFKQFCELERHDSPTKQLTVEEEECETFFQNNTSRDSSGRYIVRLPFRLEPTLLGNSQFAAIKRFHHLERKLDRDQILRQAYNEFMAEYRKLGHMKPIELSNLQHPHYFLPHHCVHKLDSSSTKLRVVFDGSARTTSKTSLNDILMVGPTIQPDLFSIITKFRTHKYVFTADISKMYRQISMHESDQIFQCIFWRDSSEKELQSYVLNTVTYGTSSAPYLATRCLTQLADDEG